MAEPEGRPLSLEERMRLFLALVEAQDREMSVAESRKAVTWSPYAGAVVSAPFCP
jgi:hypothetical protein